MQSPTALRTFITLLMLFTVAGSFAQTATAPPTAKPSQPTMIGLPESDEGLPGAGPIRRGDWFRSIWNDRRQMFARRSQQEQGAVVFFGDSITQGWGDDLRGAFHDAKVANRGISGDTTRGMLVRLDEDVLTLDPCGVVMLMGTNDIDDGASPQTIAGNIRRIIDKLHEHNRDLPIVLCEVMPSSKSKNRPAATIRELNRQLGKIVKGERKVTLLDTWTLFANADGDAKSEEFPDLLHPNAAGYAKWAKKLSGY